VQLVIFLKLHLVLHACVQKFDVTENLENFWKLTWPFPLQEAQCLVKVENFRGQTVRKVDQITLVACDLFMRL